VDGAADTAQRFNAMHPSLRSLTAASREEDGGICEHGEQPNGAVLPRRGCHTTRVFPIRPHQFLAKKIVK